MNHISKIVLLCTIILAMSGCASTENKSPLFNFVNGAVSNYENRQQRHIQSHQKTDNKFDSSDVAAGGINVVLQSIVSLFSSDEKNN